jgi:hypothetical protein
MICNRVAMREVSTINRGNVVDSKDLLMVSLAKYYSSKQLVQKIIPIIEGKSDISLRLIDWFVTNYSKKNSTIVTRNVDNNVVHFNVFQSYRSQLKAYSKHQFDPFRRRERIKFFFDKDSYIETTIGQLNFFRWILQNGILDYIADNILSIEQDMISCQKENNIQKKQESTVVGRKDSGTSNKVQRKKRNELSKSYVKNMNRFDGSRLINFD